MRLPMSKKNSLNMPSSVIIKFSNFRPSATKLQHVSIPDMVCKLCQKIPDEIQVALFFVPVSKVSSKN